MNNIWYREFQIQKGQEILFVVLFEDCLRVDWLPRTPSREGYRFSDMDYDGVVDQAWEYGSDGKVVRSFNESTGEVQHRAYFQEKYEQAFEKVAAKFGV